MTDDLNWDILDRYFSGESTPAEAASIERWIEADPTRGQLLRSLRDVWERTGTVPRGIQVNVEAAWRATQPRLAQTRPRVVPLRVTVPRRSYAFRYAAAAMLALALGAGLVWRATQGPELAPPVAVEMRDYVTPAGQRADFRLADGTHVVLGPASRLRVPADYGAESRNLHLEGEAYFEVTHDAERRFFVHTATAVTEDLGTRFVVRAYPADSATRVVVTEGRVATDPRMGSTEPAVLTAGELARVDAGGDVDVRRGIDVERYIAWTEGRLVFRNTPLAEALPELSRWYDLDFRLADSALASRRLTAVFRTQPTDEILALLAISVDATHERSGRTVTFYPKDRTR